MPLDTLRETIPDDWEQGLTRTHFVHKRFVAALYRVDGGFVASANEQWLDGTWPTFDEAAAAALACEPMTWVDLRRRRAEDAG